MEPQILLKQAYIKEWRLLQLTNFSCQIRISTLYYMNFVCCFSLVFISLTCQIKLISGKTCFSDIRHLSFGERFHTYFCCVCIPHQRQEHKHFGHYFAQFQIKMYFSYFFSQILQEEKEKQELQHQVQLSELMDKQAREVQRLGQTLTSVCNQKQGKCFIDSK